ncbi:pre-rRNA processing protein Rrp12 [Blastomyces gilchristii SLH14081]|uniref:Pre-rRNA processing protein Rrp12 n=1 Tax=Blastomyces gilchristii (strain SLH14081) TaxID=559298 RepID=A0A179US10_BLAGS|nr:pre-rRNA processing protein Rrp12 [Blastomyces gilchristii SLH14081]OAT10019.1 pre-rRNA processing protein Rrp12 [Blastomyces gilchristii SLH14081]
MATLQEKLDKIKSPKLQNQHHTSVVLSAVEDTLRDQNADFTATAYFAALLALLGQAISTTQGIVNKDLASSIVYLLDTVAPFVPGPLLVSKFSQILTSLAPALTLPEAEAPLLKSSVGCLQSLLVAQDSAAWALPPSQIGPRRAMAGLMALAVDHRPKVRKRVHDTLIYVLKNPPPSPSLDHPAADMCAETALHTLSESITAAAKAKKGRHGQQQASQHEPMVIHAVQLVKTIATASGGWPTKKIEPLCELLMNVSKSSNEYLTMAAFEVFEIIFEGMADDFSSSKLPRLMETISELKPAQNDSQLLPPWIAVLSRGYDVSAQVNPEETFEKLPELFDLISSFLASPSRNIRVSASECLISFLVNCIPDTVILEPSIYDEKVFEKLAKIATGLLSVKYQAAWMEVFNLLAAMFDALKWRSFPVLTDTLRTVGELRGNESFTGKKQADQVLGSAIAAMGPEAVLQILPLNITHQKAGQPGRVWLLPILRDHVSNTRLSFFRSEFVPLSEALFQRVLEYGNAEKTVEVKIFETLVQQTWAILPGFCELPLDLTESFDQSFAELLANVLYKQTELRVDVCRALQNLVESNQAISSLDTEQDDLILQRRITKEAAKKNLAHLASFSSNLLAVLFNVYSQTLPQFRGFLLRCINAYLSITGEQELIETFTRVTTMLEGSLNEPEPAEQKQPKGSGDKMPPASHTLMDLVVTISIYLPRSSFVTLFSLAAVVLNKKSSDPQLIKKAYKLIPRLATTENGAAALRERSSELQSLILATADQTPAPARRDRLLAVHEIVTYLPTSDLYFIPSVLPEVVLGCKESNEKARTAAFSLLVHLAQRTIDPDLNPAGTVIRNSLVPHMPDTAPDAPATIEEFFTMVSAGLAGSSPHMVAASVTALSRLLFEFHTKLPASILSDLVQTIDLFLTSNSREIVRSVLGFVKVAVVVLPEDMLRPRLDSLVPNLLVWSKEHKGRLKSKVKGILERLIRRFGAPLLEGLVGEADRKFVVAIRKERERRKRKKAQAKEGGDEDEDGDEHGGDASRARKGASATVTHQPRGGEKSYSSEFDKAVYGSDMSDSDFATTDSDDASEIDIDEQGNMHVSSSSHKSGRKQQQQQQRGAGGAGRQKPSRPGAQSQTQYIRELSPESNPLDLLAPDALASISTTKPSVRFLATKTRKRAARVDADGKLLLGLDGDGDVGMASGGAGGSSDRNGGGGGEGAGEAEGATSVNAYLSAVSGPDAVRRGQRGRLKVSQGRKRGGDEMDIDDDEGGVEGAKAIGREVKGASGSGRRGLGAEKVRGESGRVEKRGSGKGGRFGGGRGSGGRGGRGRGGRR